MSINLSDENKNVLDSIRVNREFDSNKSDERELQYEKPDGPTNVTFPGISID
jgi:hypothetical protein